MRNPAHSEDKLFQTEHPAEESNLVLRFRRPPCSPAHSQGKKTKYPDLESNQDLDLRRVGCAPLHHRDRSFNKSRRLPVFFKRLEPGTCIDRFTKPAPCSSSHVGKSRTAGIRTPWGGFGGRLLSQEHDPVSPVEATPAWTGNRTISYFSSSTFQYASLTNLAQLSIRTR